MKWKKQVMVLIIFPASTVLSNSRRLSILTQHFMKNSSLIMPPLVTPNKHFYSMISNYYQFLFFPALLYISFILYIVYHILSNLMC